jgi:hypothetical protein
MRRPFITRLTKGLPTVITAAVLMQSGIASAGPVIGFDPTGSGSYTTYADIWTNVTDSALSVGFIPGAAGQAAVPYTTNLIAQAIVGTMSDSNTPAIVTPSGLNVLYELTKVLSVQQLVTSQTADTAIFTLGPAQPDIDSSTPGSQQLMIFFDDITDGSKAVPGNGTGTVSDYGAGPTSGGNDGVLILSAHVVSLTASFAASGAIGTGSFDIGLMLDFVNPNYLDVATGSIIGEKITGTTNVPSFFTPDVMWNGTSTGSPSVLLKVDGSETFNSQVPEPATLALLGLGMLSMGLTTRRRKQT